jgi:hypothetical protein
MGQTGEARDDSGIGQGSIVQLSGLTTSSEHPNRTRPCVPMQAGSMRTVAPSGSDSKLCIAHCLSRRTPERLGLLSG